MTPPLPNRRSRSYSFLEHTHTHTITRQQFFRWQLQTWVSRHSARYAVVAVEELPPQKLVSGDGLPLSACLTGSQHGIVGQAHEDLQHQAVWQDWDTLHPDILLHRARGHTHQDDKSGVVTANIASNMLFQYALPVEFSSIFLSK